MKKISLKALVIVAILATLTIITCTVVFAVDPPGAFITSTFIR